MKKLFALFFIAVAGLASAQNGITWSAGMNIATSAYDNMHPRIVTDASGDPIVIWGRMTDTSVYLSRWNGSSFTVPVRLNPSGMPVASATWMGPDIASHGDTVYVVMKRMPESLDSNHIYIIRSFDGGATFSSPFRVDYIADSLSRFPAVTVDVTGNPVVGFMKFNSSFADSRWAVTRSTDFGNSFTTDVKASGWSGGEVCDCCPGAIVNSGSSVAMLYRDNLSNLRDSWTGISTDTGNSFTSGIGIDNNNWLLMSCPSSGPDGIIIGDTLYSVFMSSGTGNMRSYESKVSLSGSTTVTVQSLGGIIPGLTSQNFPRIASDGQVAAMTWVQVAGGVTTIPLLYTPDVASGFSSVFDTVDMNNITNVDIAVSNGSVYVVWQDDNSGTVKFRSGTFSVNTGLTESKNVSFSIYPNPASEYLTIQPAGIGPSAELTILNVLGELCFHKTIFMTEPIDVSGLPAGIYTLRFESGSIKLNSHFVKN